jgi:hypothetical protein
VVDERLQGRRAVGAELGEALLGRERDQHGQAVVGADDVYGASMRFRVRLAAGIALLLLGLGAGPFGYPLSPQSDPASVDVRFPGSYAAPGTVTVVDPGAYALWESGTTGGDRCAITGPGGEVVAVGEPGLTVRWEPDGEDAIDTYTQVGTFDAPRAGDHGISCTIDDAPGTAFAVTRKPGTGLALAVLVGGVVAILAGIAVVVVAFLRRRSALHQVQ